jgi:1-acyl-sn-glycerol-3-phosphate acyltransferase
MLAWLSFGFAVVFTMTVALIVPGAERRQKLATWACRMTFVLPMIDVRIRGIDNLPAGNCVVVANHASYLDGVLLKGYLPWRFSFVIKGEMRDFAPARISKAARATPGTSSGQPRLVNRWLFSRRAPFSRSLASVVSIPGPSWPPSRARCR